MSDAVERARQALRSCEINCGRYAESVVALRDLLAEIDSGVWLDTREVEALLVDKGLEVFPTLSPRGRWAVYDVEGDEYISYHATARDAVRAARGATDA